MQASESKELYLAAFKQYQNNGAAKNPAWLQQLRRSAIANFHELGFPTTRDEDWKYTSVEPITSIAFQRGNGDLRAMRVDEVLALALAEPDCNRLVFINGIHCPELSSVHGLPESVRIESLAALWKRNEDFLQPYLGRSARPSEQAFVALNTAFMEDGAFIFVPKNCKLEAPIHLIYVAMAKDEAVASYPRNLFILEDGSAARIVESYVGPGKGATFASAVTELQGGEDTTIDLYRLQREGAKGAHIGTLEAHLRRNCNFTAHAITLGGRLVRNDVHVVLDGEGSECLLNGLYLIDGKQHVDNETEIEHRRPRATSLEVYKGILSGSARGVFNGKILVHKDAQKTNARQTNKNLLLSADAMINTKPQLEIYADDVKCSHGSTIGQLDREALFYLRSRGLSLDDAQGLLRYAFASEVISRVKIDSLRGRLNDYLLNKFGKDQKTEIQ